MKELLLISLFAGIAIPLGAILTYAEKLLPQKINKELNHAVVAFGGGALLSAVALVLVPEGIEKISLISVAISFCGGGILFMLLDYLLSKAKGSMANLVAMLTDFIPEAIALGASMANGIGSGILLASIMFLQNLPEGFNAFKELTPPQKKNKPQILLLFFLLASVGPLMAFIGKEFLSNHEQILANLKIFASGGIIYLVFQDIAPQANLKRHWAPPLGAVLGFGLGIIGKMLVH